MTTQLSSVLRQRRTPIHLEEQTVYSQVTVSLNGRGVSLRQCVRGADVKTKNQFVVRAGQFIYSRIDARNGAMGIIPPDLDGAIVTSDFPVFDVDAQKLNPMYLSFIARSRPFVEACKQASRGVTNRKRVKENEFLSLAVVLPELPEQERISSQISRVEATTARARLFCEQVDQQYEDLLLSIVHDISRDAPRSSMNKVAPIIRRKVQIERDAKYPELGIRSFGRGTFHKPAIKGSDLGSKRLYRIEPADLLFSNVFAWEGAIAIAQPEDKNRFGSHRFITCLHNPSKVLVEYLRTWFLSTEGMAEIRAASPGAAGRNKTLNLKKLEAIQVPIPDMPKQRRFAAVYARVQAARKLNQQTTDELEAIMPAALEQSFRGVLYG